MIGKINLSGKGIDTSDATAVAGDILSGKTAYANENKLTGTMNNQGSKTFTPSTVTQTSGAGYYSSITVNPQTGTSINGTLATYTAGATVNIGKFVKLVSSKVQQISSSSDTILGIAGSSGSSGSTIRVYVPNT